MTASSGIIVANNRDNNGAIFLRECKNSIETKNSQVAIQVNHVDSRVFRYKNPYGGGYYTTPGGELYIDGQLV